MVVTSDHLSKDYGKVSVIGKSETYENKTIEINFYINLDDYKIIKEKEKIYLDIARMLNLYYSRLIHNPETVDSFPRSERYELKLIMKNEKIAYLMKKIDEIINNEKVTHINVFKVSKIPTFEEIQAKNKVSDTKTFYVFLNHDDIYLSKDHPHVLEVEQEIEKENNEKARKERILYLKKDIREHEEELKQMKYDIEDREQTIERLKEKLGELEK